MSSSIGINEEFQAGVREFADRVDAQTAMRLIREGYGNQIEANRVAVAFGRKYARVDVGSSGRYMVENATGEIYGIKSYGVIHRGHHYGNLNDIEAWDFGGYRGQRRM